MKLSEALREAKEHLWDGAAVDCIDSFRYICNATNDRRITLLMSKLLSPQNTLEGWLETNHQITVREEPEDRIRIQATRHAWLDHLIAHYEALGD